MEPVLPDEVVKHINLLKVKDMTLSWKITNHDDAKISVNLMWTRAIMEESKRLPNRRAKKPASSINGRRAGRPSPSQARPQQTMQTNTKVSTAPSVSSGHTRIADAEANVQNMESGTRLRPTHKTPSQKRRDKAKRKIYRQKMREKAREVKNKKKRDTTRALDSAIQNAVDAIADVEEHLLPPQAPHQSVQNMLTKAENAVSIAESTLRKFDLPEQNSSLVKANMKMLLWAAKARSAGEPTPVKQQSVLLKNIAYSRETETTKEECENIIDYTLGTIGDIDSLAPNQSAGNLLREPMLNTICKAKDAYKHLAFFLTTNGGVHYDITKDIIQMLLDSATNRAQHDPVPTEQQFYLLCNLLDADI